jgi:adenylyl-sulfate kinase
MPGSGYNTPPQRPATHPVRPIFVQAMWRTGSTYIWKKFRDQPKYRAYYEPLHEALAQPSRQVLPIGSAATWSYMRHPPLDSAYFAEYPFMPDGGAKFFEKPLSYERYFLAENDRDGPLHSYIQNLIDHAALHNQTAVLQFNRGLLRAGWLTRQFNPINILVLRRPCNVWRSFLSIPDPYFVRALFTILGQNALRPPLSYLPRWIEIPCRIRKTIEEDFAFYGPLALQGAAKFYPSFFDFDVLTTFHCARYADCILDLDEISSNPVARAAAENRLRDLGISIALDDCHLPSYPLASGEQREWLAYENFSRRFLGCIFIERQISLPRERLAEFRPFLSPYFRDLFHEFAPVAPSRAPATIAAKATTHHQKGIGLFHSRAYPLSARELSEALALAPNAERWNDWASAQAASSHRLLAELGFRQALQIDPNDGGACANLGALLCSLDRHAEALPFLERALPAAQSDSRLTLQRLIATARKSIGAAAPAAGSALEPQTTPPARETQTPVARSHGNVVPDFDRQPVIDRIASRLESLDDRPAIPGSQRAEILAGEFSYEGLPRGGYTIFLTGLSGAGKTTIANLLVAKLPALRGQSISLLDGDLVRMHLSSELGFSREHRDLNIRRIAFVASEIAKCGGVAVCAVIAPFDRARKQARAMVEPHGGFFLVHVSTPLDVCELRDPKGLYAKARAGIIPQFTGVSDPYEEPSDAEIRIDAGKVTPEDAVHQILSFIARDSALAAPREPALSPQSCLA